jgi:hypothetical protein
MPSGMIFRLQETASGSEMDGIDRIKRTTDSVHDQRVLVRRFPLRAGVDFLITGSNHKRRAIIVQIKVSIFQWLSTVKSLVLWNLLTNA